LSDPINPANGSQNALALRRLHLEVRVGEAIARAQKQYLRVQTEPAEAPTKSGPNHLGTKIDVRA